MEGGEGKELEQIEEELEEEGVFLFDWNISQDTVRE
jgi:hypothetical protein